MISARMASNAPCPTHSLQAKSLWVNLSTRRLFQIHFLSRMNPSCWPIMAMRTSCSRRSSRSAPSKPTSLTTSIWSVYNRGIFESDELSIVYVVNHSISDSSDSEGGANLLLRAETPLGLHRAARSQCRRWTVSHSGRVQGDSFVDAQRALWIVLLRAFRRQMCVRKHCEWPTFASPLAWSPVPSTKTPLKVSPSPMQMKVGSLILFIIVISLLFAGLCAMSTAHRKIIWALSDLFYPNLAIYVESMVRQTFIPLLRTPFFRRISR